MTTAAISETSLALALLTCSQPPLLQQPLLRQLTSLLLLLLLQCPNFAPLPVGPLLAATT